MRYPNNPYVPPEGPSDRPPAGPPPGPGRPGSRRPQSFGRGDHSAPGPTGRGDLPPAGETQWFPAPSPTGRLPNAPMSFTPRGRAGFRPPPDGAEALWEPWEPPYDPAGAAPDAAFLPADRSAELVREADDADQFSIWAEPPATRRRSRRGPGGPGGQRSGSNRLDGGGRRGAQHARRRGRPPRGNGLAIAAGVLAIAGAIPLGILAMRTVAHHGPPLTSAPMSASRPGAPAPGQSQAAAPPTFSAVAGPGCPPATGATTYPYQSPNGDGWHTGLAAASGPCGPSYVYSSLAMVPGNPGEWHDHYAWIFRTGMTAPSCTLSFYIPASPQTNSVAYYWFSAGSAYAVNRIADFTIDQASHQGQWVSHGPFTFPGGTILVEVTDRGEAPAPATAVAGPMRLAC
jgi:hypothetical protein